MQTNEDKPVTTLHEYLNSDQGRKFLSLLHAEVSRLGELPAKEAGLRYALLRDASENLQYLADCKPGAAKFCAYDIPVHQSILNADPEKVLESIVDWTGMDYAPTALDQCFDDDGLIEQTRYMFMSWSMANGEPIMYYHKPKAL